jgi:uracil-DNA glycosylase family 4
MIIGIAPGKNEMKLGQPFVGESGRLLDSVLRAAGWDRADVYCTNLICTWNDNPSAQEIASCAQRLRDEIIFMKPRLIITLGKLASEQVYPEYTIGQMQGAVLWTTDILGSGHDCYVLPTYHPAAVLHGSSFYIHPIYRDLSKIKTVVMWEPDSPLATLNGYWVAIYDDDLKKWLRERPYGTTVAVDIETAQGKDEDGLLDVHNDRLLCVGLSDGFDTIVVPEQFTRTMTEEDWCIPKINWAFHNGNFDVQGIYRFLDIKLPIEDDTMLMSYNLDERAGVHKLKTLAREYLGAGFYETQAHRQAKERKGYEYVDPDVLYEYNARDATYTARLVEILRMMMKADNVLGPYNELLIPAANVFADIQYRGMHVDMDRMNELELKWYPMWLQAGKDLIAHGEALGAPAPFNPNSNPQMKHLFFDILKLKDPLGKRTKGGAQSLDKEVMEEMKGQHPFVDEIFDYRQLDHIVSNMLMVRDHVKLDGAVHATTKQHGTVTGRTSYVDPALQTFPNPKYERNARFKEFREIFVPFNAETHVIGEADLSRAEMWAAVTYSGDEQMLEDLRSGDPHTQTAMAVLNKSRERVTRQDRTDMKHVTFGKMYGRGAKALAKGELKCSVAQAEAFVSRWDRRYAGYMEWNRRTRAVAQEEGELVSLTGRKRRFRLILPDDYMLLNEGANFPIQNLASDTTLKAMIKLHPLLAKYDSYILIMIHDSLVFELSKEWLHVTLPLIKEVMEGVMFPGAYPIPIELAVGTSWGTTKEIDIEEFTNAPVHSS